MKNGDLALWKCSVSPDKEIGLICHNSFGGAGYGFETVAFGRFGEVGWDEAKYFTLLAPKVLTSWEE